MPPPPRRATYDLKHRWITTKDTKDPEHPHEDWRNTINRYHTIMSRKGNLRFGSLRGDFGGREDAQRSTRYTHLDGETFFKKVRSRSFFCSKGSRTCPSRNTSGHPEHRPDLERDCPEIFEITLFRPRMPRPHKNHVEVTESFEAPLTLRKKSRPSP